MGAIAPLEPGARLEEVVVGARARETQPQVAQGKGRVERAIVLVEQLPVAREPDAEDPERVDEDEEHARAEEPPHASFRRRSRTRSPVISPGTSTSSAPGAQELLGISLLLARHHDGGLRREAAQACDEPAGADALQEGVGDRGDHDARVLEPEVLEGVGIGEVAVLPVEAARHHGAGARRVVVHQSDPLLQLRGILLHPVQHRLGDPEVAEEHDVAPGTVLARGPGRRGRRQRATPERPEESRGRSCRSHRSRRATRATSGSSR